MGTQAASRSNRAPACLWVDQNNFMPDGVTQQRLYVDGRQTPYFITVSDRLGHRTDGSKVGLYGAGMHPKGIALTLASGPRIAPLKHRAEQMALGAL